MDTVGQVTKAPDGIIERHLLGLGVLVVTVSAGYFLSGLSGSRAPQPAVQEARVEVVEEDNNPADADGDADAELTIDVHIKEVAARHGVRADLVAAVIEAESDFNPRAVSRVGAIGLVQVMPSTAVQFEKTATRERLYDPEVNLRIGFRYLRRLIGAYGGDVRLALLAYNLGEELVDEARKSGKNPLDGYNRILLKAYTGSGVAN